MLQTKIQWTDTTINFWMGCRKVSDGCKYCYMYRDKERYGQDPFTVVRVSAATIMNILKSLKDFSKIFTCSWSDFFIEYADVWRADDWKVIKAHPLHQWHILTKRPERIRECLPDDWGDGYDNVWIGVSIENQKVALPRLKALIEVPAAVKFVSAEPLLEPVDLMLDKCITGDEQEHSIDWVIIGGESGNEVGKYLYRPCEIEWIEDIIQQCKNAQVPVFVKQLGTHLKHKLKLSDRHGGDIDEWPAALKIREFPLTVSYCPVQL